MATKPQEQPDDFAAAFASFATGGEPPANDEPAAAAEPPTGSDPAEPPADPAGGPAADAGDQPGDAGADGGTPAGAVAEPGPGAEPAGDPAPAAAEDPATDDLVRRLAKLVQDAPAAAESEPQPQAQAPAAPEPQAEIYSDDEKAFLADYDKDWADVTRGEALKRRAEYRDLIGFVFNQVADQLRPLLETVDVLSTRTHLDDLRTRVEDYDTVRDNVVSWVAEQPAYLQAAYNNVIRQGTAEEVADLIGRYRQATGTTAAPAAPAPTPAKPVELSEDAKKAAQALAPVNTKRASIPQDDDANDFDAAFRRFAAQGKT